MIRVGAVDRFQCPAGEKCTKFGFVGEMWQFLALARQESESLAVCAAVDDAGICAGFANLFPGLRVGVRA